MKQKIAVLGPGSWGTALAQTLAENGHDVRIWGNVPEQIDEIKNLGDTIYGSYNRSTKAMYENLAIGS